MYRLWAISMITVGTAWYRSPHSSNLEGLCSEVLRQYWGNQEIWNHQPQNGLLVGQGWISQFMDCGWRIPNILDSISPYIIIKKPSCISCVLLYISLFSWLFNHNWLVVLTILKIISQWEGLSHILWNIKNVWNHQPVYIYIICMSFSLMVAQSPENHELIINHGIKNPHMFEC